MSWWKNSLTGTAPKWSVHLFLRIMPGVKNGFFICVIVFLLLGFECLNSKELRAKDEKEYKICVWTNSHCHKFYLSFKKFIHYRPCGVAGKITAYSAGIPCKHRFMSWLIHFSIICILALTWKKQQQKAQGLGSHRRLVWGSRLLASVWLQTGHCSNLGSEQADGGSISCKINTIKKSLTRFF